MQSADEVLETMRGIIAKMFRVPSQSIEANTVAADVKGWDSMAHIVLLVQVEKRFSVEFDTGRVSNFRSVGDLVDEVVRLSA